MFEEGKVNEKREQDTESNYLHTDLLAFHEQNAGRLIVDPECVFLFCDRMLRRRDVWYHREAKVELGEEVAARLKLTKDGTKILWPQPTDSEKDPQNWAGGRKDIQLLIITLAAFVPDFDSGIGKQFQVTWETGLDWLSNFQALHLCSHWLNNTIPHPVWSIIWHRSKYYQCGHLLLFTLSKLEYLPIRYLNSNVDSSTMSL